MIATPEEQRDQALRVEEALRQVLERQEAWHCNRVWEAWAVDTMSRDDFSLVTEDPVAIEELVQAAMSAFRAVQGEPNDDREALRKEFEYRIRKAVAYGSGLGYRELPVQERADWIQREIRNAVAIASRATVPDAATERFEKAEHDRLYWRRRYQSMHKRAKAAEVERDAALAAIERVQETLSLHNPNGRLVKEVLAALDGAPEPDDDPCKAETHSWSHYRPEQIDSYWIRCTRLGKHDEHEDSNTGLEWRSRLPVEGESKP